MRRACTAPSSCGGVNQMISMGAPIRFDRSFAAVSAPRRADRNTGFVELFAIIAMRIGFPASGVEPMPPSPPTDGGMGALGRQP